MSGFVVKYLDDIRRVVCLKIRVQARSTGPAALHGTYLIKYQYAGPRLPIVLGLFIRACNQASRARVQISDHFITPASPSPSSYLEYPRLRDIATR